MIVWIAAVGLGALAATGGFKRLRRVQTVLACDPSGLGRALEQVASGEDLRRLENRFRAAGGSREAELIDAALQPSEPRRVAAINEVLSDLDSELGWGTDLPASCAKIAFLGSLCLAIVTALAGQASVAMLAWVVGWGAFGVVAPLLAGRAAERRAHQQRKEIDQLVGVVLAVAARADDRQPTARGGVDSEPPDV